MFPSDFGLAPFTPPCFQERKSPEPSRKASRAAGCCVTFWKNYGTRLVRVSKLYVGDTKEVDCILQPATCNLQPVR
jgi:hypothetical protein